MEVFIVIAIIWIIAEVWKEHRQGTPADPTWRKMREMRERIDRNFPNVK